jgi:IS1 family transposase
VRRKGNVVARVIQNVSALTLEAFVNEAVSHKVGLLCTDQWTGYRNLKKTFPHVAIDHSHRQYVVGAVHTNTIEGFWSIFQARDRGHFPQRE